MEVQVLHPYGFSNCPITATGMNTQLFSVAMLPEIIGGRYFELIG